MFPPPLYHRLQRSELVASEKLDAVLKQAYRKFQTLSPEATAASASETPRKPSFRPDVSFEGDELAEFFFPPSTADVLDDFERYFLEELRTLKALNSWQASQLASGRVRFVLDKYRIVKQLGQGGYGQVFLGRPRANPSNRASVVFSDDVAVKVLPLRSGTPRATAKFLREVEISRLTEHRNIVRFIESAKDASVHFAVYEYADGGDARRLLTKLGRMNYRVAAYLVSETATALAHMHSKGLVHRDVKPGNVLLTKAGEVKLGDFGFVSPTANFSPTEYYSPLGATIKELEERLVEEVFPANASDDEAKATFRQQIQGTPDYLAPDQIKNPENPTPLWDVYSLGCALYFLLTGVVPFPSENAREKLRAHFKSEPPEPSTFDASIPGEISRLTMRMMAKAPENRVQTAKEVADALRPWFPAEIAAEVAERAAVPSDGLRRRKDNKDNFWSQENLLARFGDKDSRFAPFVDEIGFDEKEKRGKNEKKASPSDSSSNVASPKPSVSNGKTPFQPPRLSSAPSPRQKRGAPPILKTPSDLVAASQTLKIQAFRWEKVNRLAFRYVFLPAAFVLTMLAAYALTSAAVAGLPANSPN